MNLLQCQFEAADWPGLSSLKGRDPVIRFKQTTLDVEEFCFLGHLRRCESGVSSFREVEGCDCSVLPPQKI